MKIRYILIIVTLLFSSFVLNACKCGACQKQEETEVPYSVLEKANKFIISKTGKDFFEKYISPDFTRTKNLKPNYYMVYRFLMPEKKYVDATIEFTVDSLGNVLMDREISGIPEYLAAPESCNYSIDKEKAVSIARHNNLPKGIKEWQAGFIWSAKYNRYVWHILSVLNEVKVGDTFRGSGEEVMIDPVSGSVLEMNKWNVR
ncbi:MAG: hypothetical protein Q8903_12115 [Bacteroidota bacterium]|nr:hypothetical protein [Bacteroidota bacterium]